MPTQPAETREAIACQTDIDDTDVGDHGDTDGVMAKEQWDPPRSPAVPAHTLRRAWKFVAITKEPARRRTGGGG